MKLKAREEIKNKEKAELITALKDAQKRLQEAKLEQSQFKLKNTNSLTTIRKEIAVILTVMKEKELSVVRQVK